MDKNAKDCWHVALQSTFRDDALQIVLVGDGLAETTRGESKLGDEHKMASFGDIAEIALRKSTHQQFHRRNCTSNAPSNESIHAI